MGGQGVMESIFVKIKNLQYLMGVKKPNTRLVFQNGEFSNLKIYSNLWSDGQSLTGKKRTDSVKILKLILNVNLSSK